VFPGAAVSLYPVNKYGIAWLFVAFLVAKGFALSANRKNAGIKTSIKNKKAGANAGPLQLAVGVA
jgi:hypothetical protein